MYMVSAIEYGNGPRVYVKGYRVIQGKEGLQTIGRVPLTESD
jgi:hypothetical protein